MQDVVLPEMAKVFQRFDGKLSAGLTCRTCHGGDAEEARFRMPRALPALSASHLPDGMSAGPMAHVARFMWSEVTPRMAELLGVEPYDRRTGRGFGCLNCHPRA